jgi:DNA primase
MARITEASKQAIFDRLDAVEVAGDYLRLEQKGGRYWGLCPFHHEKTPSFTVDPDRKLYYCFGCHKGGTIIDLIMEMDKLSFAETLERLARRFGVELIYEGDYRRDTEKERRSEALAELYRRVALTFHHFLMETPQGAAAKQYIINREISAETINAFNLGYSPQDRSWLFGFLSKKGFSRDFLAESGLFSQKYPGSAFFSGRLMFPITDRQGRTVAFGGRILSGDGPKYLNSAETELFKKGKNLFALDIALPGIRTSKTAVLAEGYMDVLALHQAGLRNAVAPLGTAFTDDQARLLKRWAEQVVLALDADEAGQNAAVKAVLACRRNGLACFVTVPPGGEAKDPAEILQKNGAEALQNFVKSSILDFDYLLSKSRALNTGKSEAAVFLFPYLAALDSEVSRDSCIGLMADEFGVSSRAVREDYDRYAVGEPRKALAESVTTDDPPRMNGELYLMTAVFLHPDFFRGLRSKLSAEDLEDRHARELFIVLEEWFRKQAGGDPPFSALDDRRLKDFVMKRGVEGAFSNPERIVRDSIARLRAKKLERRRKEIVRELRSPGLQGEQQGDLLAEKLSIDSELTGLDAAEELSGSSAGPKKETN